MSNLFTFGNALASSEVATHMKSYEFHGLEFEISSDWTKIESGDENVNNFYPPNGMVNLTYYEGMTVENDLDSDFFTKDMEQFQGKLDNERIIKNTGDYEDGLLYDFEMVVEDEKLEGIALFFNHEDGMVSVVCATSTAKGDDYTDEYYAVLESMGFERVGNATDEKAFDAGDYDRAYAVEFQDYSIFYLIDEDNKTITIFTSDEPQTEYVSEYSGDLDEGMNFDWNGLKMQAHLKEPDDVSWIVVSDETGNVNDAKYTNVEDVVGRLNRGISRR